MSTAFHVWTASLRAFGLRSLGIFIVTFVLLFPAWPVLGGWAAFGASIVLCLLYMFVLDDFTQWLAHRKAIWTLTPNELIYENPSEDTEPHALPLSEITSVAPRFLWNIQLRLSNGTAITMHYIDGPKAVCQLIDNAIKAQTKTQTETRVKT